MTEIKLPEDKLTITRVNEIVSTYMNNISAMFKPGNKITVVVRNPDIPGDTTFMLTNDDLGELVNDLAGRIPKKNLVEI